MTEERKHKICRFCRFFIKRTQEEYCNTKSYEEAKRFNGYCRRYPKQEEVKYGYLCGEWIYKKDKCPFKDNNGMCINDCFIPGRLCKDLECDIDVL